MPIPERSAGREKTLNAKCTIAVSLADLISSGDFGCKAPCVDLTKRRVYGRRISK